MALFGGKNKKAVKSDVTEDVKSTATNNEPVVDEKQRQKKIKKMKAKFDETVWSNAVDVMKSDIPKFVITEQDPDDADSEIVKYVLLGFDTKIVDDFSNKSDDDIGSIMTAIKNSMNCVIENGLFDNELILMIPTTKTLAALREFEDVFNLKFYITYVTEDHGIILETKSGTDDSFVSITLDQIQNMLDNNIYIKDQIKMLQEGTNDTTDEDSIEAPESSSTDDSQSASSDVTPKEQSEEKTEESEEDFEGADRDEEMPDEEGGDNVDADEVSDVVTSAVGDASKIAQKMKMTKNDVDETVESAKEKTEDVKTESVKTEPVKEETAGDENKTATALSSAKDKLAKLQSTVQKASDNALEDKDIKSSAANINPQNRVNTFDAAAMDQYITRKYYSDDLGLEVSSEPFDAMFMQSNSYIAFTEVEGDDWLSGYVNNIRRDANTRLAKLHNENLLIMRERFMLIITKHCESIVKSVSTDDPNSRFGYTLQSINSIKNDSIAKLRETSEAYKREKEDDYQSRLKIEMDNAANVAKANFINAYGKAHEAEMREIENDLRNNIESEYVAAVENLKNERRNEAKRQLDAGISEALKICADEYTKMLAMERKEYARLQAVITDFQNENMAADEARIYALSEEQRRSNEVVKVREEYDSKYALANKDFEAKLAAIQAEIEKTNIEHDNYVDELRDQHERMMQDLRNSHKEQINHKDHEISLLNEQLDTANTQIQTLTVKYSEQDENINRKYANQIGMLKSEREAWVERAQQVENLHKYSDKLKLTGMVVGVIAALGIGVIIGCAVSANNANNNTATTEAPIIHYITDEEGEQGATTKSDKNSKEISESDNAKPANKGANDEK